MGFLGEQKEFFLKELRPLFLKFHARLPNCIQAGVELGLTQAETVSLELDLIKA